MVDRMSGTFRTAIDLGNVEVRLSAVGAVIYFNAFMIYWLPSHISTRILINAEKCLVPLSLQALNVIIQPLLWIGSIILQSTPIVRRKSLIHQTSLQRATDFQTHDSNT